MRTLQNLIKLCLLATFLQALPVVVQAQFSFVTNNGAIMITGFSGSGTAVIPNSTNGHPVTSIYYRAFTFSDGVTNITIPNNVTNIGQEAFYNCASLVGINVNPGNPSYSSLNGVLFNHNFTTLVFFPAGLGGSYFVPNSVTNIGEEAFSGCTNVTNISLTNGVTSIGEEAFANCYALTGVTIPNTVTSIGDGAFAVCTNLKSIIIPNSITNIGTIVFEDTGLTNIIIPDSVVNIGDSAFCPSYSLKSITIPASVLIIQEYAFESCLNLKYVFFKGNAPSTTSFEFSDETNATAYYLPGTTGWGTNYGGIPTALWNPQAQAGNHRIVAQNNPFGFNITGTTNIPVVVEASTNFGGAWVPLQSVSLTNGLFYFSDPQSTNFPGRCYRFRSP